MLKVNLIEARNYNDTQLETLNRVCAIIERCINSAEFNRTVLEFKTNGKLGFSFRKNLFRHFDIYTNEEVLALILQASEEYGDVNERIIDLYLVLEPGGDGQTIGYGNPWSEHIYTYADYFNGASDASLANHLVHEWCHKIGFDHAKLRIMDPNRDCCSVPYAIGNIIEELAVNPN